MSGKGEVFAVELQQLWRAGAVSLPLVADVYARASIGVWESGRHDKNALVNDGNAADAIPPAIPGESFMVISSRFTEPRIMGRLYEPFEAVRKGLNDALAQTARSFYDASAALRSLTEHYRSTDDGAATELDKYTLEHVSDPNFTAPANPPITPKSSADPYPPDPKPKKKPWWMGDTDAE